MNKGIFFKVWTMLLIASVCMATPISVLASSNEEADIVIATEEKTDNKVEEVKLLSESKAENQEGSLLVDDSKEQGDETEKECLPVSSDKEQEEKTFITISPNPSSEKEEKLTISTLVQNTKGDDYLLALEVDEALQVCKFRAASGQGQAGGESPITAYLYDQAGKKLSETLVQNEIFPDTSKVQYIALANVKNGTQISLEGGIKEGKDPENITCSSFLMKGAIPEDIITAPKIEASFAKATHARDRLVFPIVSLSKENLPFLASGEIQLEGMVLPKEMDKEVVVTFNIGKGLFMDTITLPEFSGTSPDVSIYANEKQVLGDKNVLYINQSVQSLKMVIKNGLAQRQTSPFKLLFRNVLSGGGQTNIHCIAAYGDKKKDLKDMVIALEKSLVIEPADTLNPTPSNTSEPSEKLDSSTVAPKKEEVKEKEEIVESKKKDDGKGSLITLNQTVKTTESNTPVLSTNDRRDLRDEQIRQKTVLVQEKKSPQMATMYAPTNKIEKQKVEEVAIPKKEEARPKISENLTQSKKELPKKEYKQMKKERHSVPYFVVSVLAVVFGGGFAILHFWKKQAKKGIENDEV